MTIMNRVLNYCKQYGRDFHVKTTFWLRKKVSRRVMSSLSLNYSNNNNGFVPLSPYSQQKTIRSTLLDRKLFCTLSYRAGVRNVAIVAQ